MIPLDKSVFLIYCLGVTLMIYVCVTTKYCLDGILLVKLLDQFRLVCNIFLGFGVK